MKLIREATVLPDGTVEAAHVIEQLCAHCQDPVSSQEELTGVCSNCGNSWQVMQNVTVSVTSMPAIEGITVSIG